MVDWIVMLILLLFAIILWVWGKKNGLIGQDWKKNLEKMQQEKKNQKKNQKKKRKPDPPFLGSEDGLTIEDMVIMDIMDDDF